MTEEFASNITLPDGAKDFLLQEYQSLNALYHANRATNEARLNFYVTFVATIATVTVATQSFIAPEVRPWFVSVVALITGFVGVITFRAMVKDRINTGVQIGRIKRIRAWFLKHYPMIASGLPYDTTPINRGKNGLGSNEFIVAFMNVITSVAVVLSLTSTLGSDILWSSLLAGGVIGTAIWLLHPYYKNKMVEKAEADDKKEIQRLNEIK